jgi:hypothetical protein
MIQNYITLFKTPELFFKSLKKLNYKDALLRYALPYIILSALSIMTNLSLYSSENSFGTTTFLSLSMFVLYVGAAFIFPFFSTALTHLGVLIVKGKNGFVSTFNATTNAMINALPYLLILNIIALGGVIGGDGSFLESSIYATIVVVLSLISMVHVFITEVIGLKKLQNLTTKRAIIASLIAIGILLLGIFLIAIFVFFAALSVALI